MRQRLIYLFEFYVLTMILFAVGKWGFMHFNAEVYPYTNHDLLRVFRNGLSLDASTALYFLIVPFLATAVSIWWNGWSRLRYLLIGYSALVALALALAYIADVSLYPFWGFKLDASCLQYLSTPGEAFASVSGWYLLGRIVAFILLTAFIGGLYYLIIPKTVQRSRRTTESILYAGMIPFIVIGIRGGVDESTTNVGQVYFSQHQFLNHAAVNPVFSFLSSFEKSANHIVDYDYYDEQQCRRLTGGLYPTSSNGTDTLLTTSRPDIVIILMESAGGQFTEIGGRKDIMPRLNQLADEGIYFSNCYANSWRTDRGTVSTLSGYPSFPTSSVMKMPKKTQQLPGIARSLRNEGYATAYLYGGDINFTNMRSYLVNTGFSQLTWKNDYPAEQQSTAKWGVRDDLTFETLNYMLTQLERHQPLLIGYSTLSSHEPWDVPVRHFKNRVLNAFWYLDQCIGQFIDQLKKSPQWKNTLIILLPDHGINFAGVDEMNPLRNHIPMIWTGGAVKEPRRIEKLCNQTDLAATLLGQLGIAHDDFCWSRDVLSDSYTYPFAVHNYTEGFSVMDSTGYIIYDLPSQRIAKSQSTDAQRLERMGKALLQATTKDLKTLGKR